MAPKGWSNSTLFVDVPFMDQMGYTVLITMLIIIVVSKLEHKNKFDSKGIILTENIFKTSPLFNIGSFALMLILTALYAAFWS